jgi:phosphoglycerol transferase MdoB-like AlkP superfamily enzyme
MWDQKANYDHNGFVMAFALNLPMANVDAPAGYSQAAMSAIKQPVAAPVVPPQPPDIIMVMSESFWDPTRLPGVTLTPDPLDFTRSVQSGHVLSPEFGGMTSNVEFEALTGFSNAMLPYGSIPYQQYVRSETPSLASFLKSAGYRTLAVHPFQEWFWNRGPVYEAFGFDEFLSEDQLPHIKKRGKLAGDAALIDEIINQAKATTEPLFLFAVTLQNHGPYEADRYPDPTIEVGTDAGEAARGAIRSFAQGMSDSDDSLERLIEWARKRERETIVVYFGDHLPPLGPHYVSTGFMEDNVANRFAPPAEMIPQHETPLVVWSNREGSVSDIGTVSPSFLPKYVLETAGFQHPYYTGFLGKVHERYRVVDRHLLIEREGGTRTGWSRDVVVEPLLRDFRLLQYDVMFGKGYVEDRLFPEVSEPLIATPEGMPARGLDLFRPEVL